MYSILLFLAMFCHNPKHHTNTHNCQGSQVTTLDDDGLDDNGDSGHVPPKPPTNPPPGNP